MGSGTNGVASRRVTVIVDGGIALALLVLTALQFVSGAAADSFGVIVFGVLAVLPMVLRTRRPLTVTIAVLIGVAGQLVFGAPTPTFSSFISIILCAYSLARVASRAAIIVGLAAIMVAVIGSAVITRDLVIFDFLYPVVYIGGAAAVGGMVRSWRRAVERQRVDEARLAVIEERASIARELHDVIAHGITLMVVQAEAAAEMLERTPDRAIAPIENIQRTGRQAIDEMRQVLSLLRAGESDDEPGARPGLAGIESLVALTREEGLHVSYEVKGTPRPISPGVELACYRIVQEAVTNVRKHSRASLLEVSVEYEPTAVRIEVVNDGGPAVGRMPASGHGLVGMRERARLYGGTLDAGATAGGFRVLATLPDTPGFQR